MDRILTMILYIEHKISKNGLLFYQKAIFPINKHYRI